jgi:hypothetical protein
MPLVEKRVSPSRSAEGGGLSKFLLSPHFTGILLPAVIMAAGAVYHFATVWQGLVS